MSEARILVVDDDPAITRMLSVAFRMTGLEVVCANRAFGLLNMIAEIKPALVLLDAMMPGLDGPSVTELIRKDPDLAHTPIFLYSAMDETALAQAAATCGADGFISKTTGPHIVVQTVLKHLNAP